MFYHEIVCGWQNSQLQEAAIFGTGLILLGKRCGLVCYPHEWQGAANVRRINKIQSGGPNNYGLARRCHPVLAVIATLEPFENGRGFSLRVLRSAKPRARKSCFATDGRAEPGLACRRPISDFNSTKGFIFSRSQ